MKIKAPMFFTMCLAFAAMSLACVAADPVPAMMQSSAPVQPAVTVTYAPELLASGGSVGVTEAFSDDVMPDADWKIEVEEALQYLYKNQVDIIARLEKVEQALIKVRTVAGTEVTRAVPISNGQGDFYLAPGEAVTAYSDVLTGQWHSVASPAATTRVSYTAPARSVSYGSAGTSYGSAGTPVARYAAPMAQYGSYTPSVNMQTTTYSTPTTSMSVTQTPVSSGRVGLFRGRIRIMRGGCCG